jgi:hypothetical protein
MGQNFRQDLRAAAYRHLEAAIHLHGTNRHDVAGYLFGLAAECALKQMMVSSGMRPLPEAERRDDPFFAHFELLKRMLRDTAHGRLKTELRRYSENSSFMQHWDVSMRYSDGKEIKTAWVDRWRRDAKDVIGAMDT